MRAHRLLAVAALTSTVLVLAGPAAPASAAAIGTTAGPIMSVAASGDVTVTLACIGGAAGVNGAVALPALPCGSLAKVVVNGDAGKQNVSGRPLNDSTSFPLNPTLTVNLAGGDDTAIETDRADDLDLGNGTDQLLLEAASIANTALDLGPGTDFLRWWGTTAAENVTLASNNNNLGITVTTDGNAKAWLVDGVEDFQAQLFGGDDDFNASGITLASLVDSVSVTANEGDDDMVAGPGGLLATGGPGDNRFFGAAGDDDFRSESSTDELNLGTGEDQVIDDVSLRSGGRAITSLGTANDYYVVLDSQDVVSRVRPSTPVGNTTVTNSLHRPGRQGIGPSFDQISLDLEPGDDKPDRSLVDVVAVKQAVYVSADKADDDVVDVTVPEGAWVLTEVPGGTSTINPVDPGYGTVTVFNSGPISVHGPWTSIYEGFGHRVIRDLQFRIATLNERLSIRNGLIDETKTRPSVVDGLMNTDVYRGLDVDRTFVDFLDRQADPSGRAYWINSLANGKGLRQFRAQLFGSSEYFNRAGATNAAYVRAAYRDVLGRLPDAAGETYWVNKINKGTDRGTVAKQFLASTEARRSLVEDQYLRFLGRLPTSGQSATWVTTLGNQKQGEQLLIASLATSQEYYALS